MKTWKMMEFCIRKIAFFLPVPSQPRYQKRIYGLKGERDVHCYYFTRNYFKGSPLPYPSTHLGTLTHGKYAFRAFKFLQVSLKLLRTLKGTDCIYCFGLDLALCTLPAKWLYKSKLVYEIGDIRPLQLNPNFAGFITRKLEQFLINRCDYVVVTAPGFSKAYLQDKLSVDPNKIRVIENKLHGAHLPARPVWPKREGEKITIGYFGLVACANSWETLKQIALSDPENIKIIIAGYILNPAIDADISAYGNIEFIGEYVSPDDLEKIYSKIDITWGCFPYTKVDYDQNWKWARTNRFYESCYFSKPLISLSGSDEARLVEELKIGFSVDLSDPAEAARQATEKLKNMERYADNVRDLPDSVYLYKGEHQDLLKALSALSRHSQHS